MRGSKASPFFCYFDYTAAQWDDIEKTLTTRATPGATAPGAIEKACFDLRNSACLYILKIRNRPTAKTKAAAELWRNIADLTTALESKLWELPFDVRWNMIEHHEELNALWNGGLEALWTTAVQHLADELEQRRKPKAVKPKACYQYEVLDVWTSLGGDLGIAHGDRGDGGKVTGPLSRYFAAVTRPVCGGSLHTLKDIREELQKRDSRRHLAEMAVATVAVSREGSARLTPPLRRPSWSGVF